MKRLVLLNILLLIALNLFAQSSSDRFTGYDEMVNQKVWFYNVHLMRQIDGDFIYSFKNDKPTPQSKYELYTELSSRDISVLGVYNYREKNYLEVYLTGGKYYLLINKNTDFLANTRSASYWSNMEKECLKYKYVSVNSYLLRDLNKKSLTEDYMSICWASLGRPSSLNDDVYFSFTALSQSVRFKAQDFDFFKKDFKVNLQKVSNGHVDVQTDNEKLNKESVMDSNRVFDAQLELSYSVREFLESKGEEYIPDEAVPFAVYGYSSGYYYGYLLGYEFKADSWYMTLSDHDAKYLKDKGQSGMGTRKVQAKKSDEINVLQYNKRVIQYKERLKKEEEEARKKSREILQYLRNNRAIIKHTYVTESYSDYSLKIEFYNWFTKRIKYVDLTVMAVNSVGDPRWYDKTRTVETIQCIGYIGSLDSGTYRFEDLFYDSSELIRDIVVCEAVITFEDNSKITINSQAGAAKMYLKNHDIELPNNFYKYIR